MGCVDAVELVGIEPVGSKEHGEEEDDVAVCANGLPEADEFGLPGGGFHEDDARAVFALDFAGIAEDQGQSSAADHEDDEADISAVADSLVSCGVDVLPQWNLRSH